MSDKKQKKAKPSKKHLRKSIEANKLYSLLRENKTNKDPRLGLIERYREASKIRKPDVMPGVIPLEAKADRVWMAADADITDICAYAAKTCKCAGFPGYAFLSELMQYSEYRSPSETISKEMVRRWITVTANGNEQQSVDKIKVINEALEEFNIKELFEKAALYDGQFGNGFMFINIKGHENSLDKPLLIKPESIQKGSVKGFRMIEPLWVSAYQYNSTDPTLEDFYRPRQWYVLSQKIHADRMMQFISREVADILKPAYNFGGISLTQLIIHYVEAWYRTRNSINDLISSFSLSGIKTDLAPNLSGIDVASAANMIRRAELFNALRDNGGLMLLDKEQEEFFQFNTPLTGLDKLQAQSQEQMSAPTHIPLVKLTGITPAGLNANSDGEIKVFYDYVASMQNTLFIKNLKKVIEILQLHVFGEIDPAIGFFFNPLDEPNELEKSQVRKTDAETDSLLVQTGIISVQESRQRIVNDRNSTYGGLDVDEIPSPPNLYDTGFNDGEENSAESENAEADIA